MSFTLPWSYNKFQSSWINNGTAVSGTYNTLSFRNDGNAQLNNTTIIGKASINKAISGTYDLDVAGTINAGNVLINGNAITGGGGGDVYLANDNVFTGNLNTFNANVSVGNLVVGGVANIAALSVSGTMDANTISVQNFTFTNVSSAITVSNGTFDNPTPVAGTTLKYNGAGTYTGIVDWTFSGTTTYSVYQNYGSGSFYTTTRPYPSYLALQTKVNSCTATGQSANFTLGKGAYVIKFWLQTQEALTNGRQSFQIYNSSNVLLAGLTGLNPAAAYPLFVQYDFALNLSSPTTVYIKFQQATTTAQEYVLLTGITIQQTGAMVITDNAGTSVIGGSQSIMQQLYVQNKLSVISGGASITGGLNSGTTTGTNNLSINSSFATTGTNNNSIAIGAGTLQSGTSIQKTVAIGVSAAPFNLLTNTDNVLVGYGIRTEGRTSGTNDSYSVLVGSSIMTRSNVGYNSVIGYQAGGTSGGIGGGYNSGIGAQSHMAYNGFGDYKQNYNSWVGYQALYNNRYNYNTGMGAFALKALYGGAYPAGPASEYNTALGYQAGYTRTDLNQCTFLGANSDGAVNYLTKSTAIGYGAIVDTSNTIQLGSGEDVKMNGNVYIPRQGATYQTTLGNMNVQSILSPVRYDVQPTFTSWEIWDTQGTGQILSIDTSNDIVEIDTTTITAYNMVNTSFESDNFTITSANTVVNGPVSITGDFSTGGNITTSATTYVNGPVNMTGNLIVAGNITTSATTYVNGPVNITGDFSTGGNITTSPTTYVNGPVNMTGSLIVAGNVGGSSGFLNMTNSSRIKILGGGMWNIGSGTTAMKYFEVNSANNDVAITGNNFTFSAGQTSTFNGTTSIDFITPQFTMTGNVLMNSYATTTQLHTFNNGINVNNTVGTFNNGITVNGAPAIVNTSLQTDTLSSIAGLGGTTTMYGNIAFANAGGGVKSVNNPAQNAMTFTTASSLLCSGIGALYCSSSPRIKAGYLNNSIYVSASQNIGSVYPAMICVAPASTATIVLTFNAINSAYDGMRMTIRRVSTANATAQITSNTANIYNNSGVAGNGILAANQYVQTIMCGQLTAGTYAWFYV